jgi:hypothetical protein
MAAIRTPMPVPAPFIDRARRCRPKGRPAAAFAEHAVELAVEVAPELVEVGRTVVAGTAGRWPSPLPPEPPRPQPGSFRKTSGDIGFHIGRKGNEGFRGRRQDRLLQRRDGGSNGVSGRRLGVICGSLLGRGRVATLHGPGKGFHQRIEAPADRFGRCTEHALLMLPQGPRADFRRPSRRIDLVIDTSIGTSPAPISASTR